MDNKNDSLDEDFSEIQESDDTDWKVETSNVREKAIRQRETTKALRKTLEEQSAKIAELEKPKQPEKKAEKPDEELWERLNNLTLSTAEIREADEVELAKGNFEKYKGTGGAKKFEEFIRGDGFQSDLKDLRIAKTNQKATSDIKGETGGSGVKDTPEYWRAKATKGSDGQLLFPEEMPKEMYTKVLNLLAKESGESSEELRFYNK